ncbi:MAG: GTPase Era [Lentisphaeria bacterium]|nr:GTPase Era [Lentisphaeria bacterium]
MEEIDLKSILGRPKGHVGYVAIIGRPNVGKSSFINAVLDCHLLAVSSRPQTTRNRWLGIYSTDESQMIFVDTPGAHEPKHLLGESMMDTVGRCLSDADVVLCIADLTRHPGAEDEAVIERMKKCKNDFVLCFNKTDSIEDSEVADEIRNFYKSALSESAKTIFEISAHKRDSLTPVLETITKLLPYEEFLYEKDEITDAFERDLGADLIREAVMEKLYQEVPHSIAVEIEQWQEGGKRLKIQAAVILERDNQKKIVIGKNGTMIEEIRRDSVKLLRELTGEFVDLKLFVKVVPDWRNKKKMLKNLGF